MAPQVKNIASLRPEPTVLPPAVVENLAARFRPGGLFLVVLRQDGTVDYHDAGAGVFFERYVLPLLKLPDAGGKGLKEKVAAVDPAVAVAAAGQAAVAISAWQLPGVALAAFPHVE